MLHCYEVQMLKRAACRRKDGKWQCVCTSCNHALGTNQQVRVTVRKIHEIEDPNYSDSRGRGRITESDKS